jgi:NitT/TauT family transport system substrate-binding protein
MMLGNSYLQFAMTSVFLVALVLDSSRSLAQQPALAKVRLAYPARSLSALHIQVAQEKGIYRKYGFQVEAIQMRATITVAALLSKEVQYVASIGSSVRVALRGAPVKVVTVSLTAPFFSLVSRPNFRTVQDLRDKEIGITGNPGSTNDQVVRMILRQAGLDPQRDVRLLHLGDPPVLYSAFKGGRFSAISVSLPFPVVAEQEGYKILANAAESIKLPFIGLAVSDETLRSSREQVKRMIRADVEARRYIGREKDQTVDLMMRWLGLSRSVAVRSYELVRPAISQDFNLDRAGIQKLIEMEFEQGEALKITDADLIIDSKLLAEARRED